MPRKRKLRKKVMLAQNWDNFSYMDALSESEEIYLGLKKPGKKISYSGDIGKGGFGFNLKMRF